MTALTHYTAMAEKAVAIATLDQQIATVERAAHYERVLWRCMDAGVGFEEASRVARGGGSMTCNCIETVDTMLAERNTRIMLPIMFGADKTARPMIVTDQIETGRGKKKACGMFAAFCPFCGEKYEVSA